MRVLNLTAKQVRTIEIIRQIVESVLQRREGRLHVAMNDGNRQQIGRQIYRLQSIRDQWCWNNKLERSMERLNSNEEE